MTQDEYNTKVAEIHNAMSQLEEDLHNLHIEMYSSIRGYKKALLMEKFEVRTGYKITSSSANLDEFKYIIVYKKNPTIQELMINKSSEAIFGHYSINYFIMYEGKTKHVIGNDIIKGVGPNEEAAWNEAIHRQEMEDEHPYSWVDC